MQILASHDRTCDAAVYCEGRYHLRSQSICEAKLVIIPRYSSQFGCYIGWSCRAWLVLKTPQVGLHFQPINANLNLVRESNVNSGKRRDWFGRAVNHDFERTLFGRKPFRNVGPKDYIVLNVVARRFSN